MRFIGVLALCLIYFSTHAADSCLALFVNGSIAAQVMSAPQKKAPYSVDDFDPYTLITPDVYSSNYRATTLAFVTPKYNPNGRDIVPLSTGVYKMTSNNKEFVVRMPYYNVRAEIDAGDTKREAFLGKLFQRMPIPFLPQIKLLSVADSKKVIEAIDYSWGHGKKLDPDAQLTVVPFHKGISGVDALDSFGLKDATIEEIRQKVPANIRVQLSNYWAIYTVFRIADFHAANWILQNNDTVVPIDFAWRFSAETKARVGPLYLTRQQHPFAVFRGQYCTQPLRDMMLKDVSPSLKLFFKNLNLVDLKKMAAESSYELTDDEANEILKAAHFVGSR